MQKKLFINNEWVDAKSGETISIRSPHDDAFVAEGIHLASKEDVDSAVAAARAAFEGGWSKWSAERRSKAMLKFADLAEEKADDIAAWESKAMGQPISIALLFVKMMVKLWRYYAGWTDKIAGEQHPITEEGIYRIVQYDPIGVCAGISPWNCTPIFFGFKTGAAIAAGCTSVFKTSEKSPIGVLQLGELIKEAGFPPGVINIISGDGAAGSALAHHMDIDKISFTGSTLTGRKIQEASAKSNMKRVSLELGGKSPSLIFNDADINNALDHASRGFLWNNGQACVATSRTFVHEDVAEVFIRKIKERFVQLRQEIGPPDDRKTYIGPLADRLQFDRVMGLIETGRKEGELIVGGNRIGDKGFYVEPTIILSPRDSARVYREEIFGPVLTIRTFRTEDEAIKLANDTSYGLSSCIFTSSVGRALRLSKKIKAGMVNINSAQTFGPDAPMGGIKDSGLGREGGKEGIMHYVEPKTIFIK
ncbi:aldehyde dehydrogenase [Corynespora cassiicola Philippines]|uniref:aldehyde dehydrogenase (NAD(+)) n=1 Tax=Corynespora cassiicola Philippines TaxID=1448308 RepID=A0A2T2N0G6_CORCC|nr:aldehyde dehydrogenase [Corynespora cassiicola Philippines]